MGNLLFTPSAVLDLLVQIDELKDKEVGIVETLDGNLQLSIGDSDYRARRAAAADSGSDGAHNKTCCHGR